MGGTESWVIPFPGPDVAQLGGLKASGGILGSGTNPISPLILLFLFFFGRSSSEKAFRFKSDLGEIWQIFLQVNAHILK